MSTPLRGSETEGDAASTGAPYKRCLVLTWSDKDGPREARIESDVRLGSSPDTDVRVGGSTVSRLHCAIELRDDGAWIRDLGSKNGTRVNGLRVQSSSLPHQAQLRLGQTEIAVSYTQSATLKAPYAHARFGPLLGGSLPMRELYAALERVASSDAAALVQGESGTGKELVARALHDASPRKDAPFVVVDCGALPENLLDAELFGHAKGAFTGADRVREGAFEAANGGTIFLDEIGELPLSMQPKLLRVLEAKTVRRVGETHHRPVDVRFVSATHRDLARMVNAGAFREDLYFRLSVIPLRVPALREREDDVPLLLSSFLEGQRVAPDVLRDLQLHPWPGNVRELKNFAERVRVLGVEHALSLFDAHRDASKAPLTPPAQESAPQVAGDLADTFVDAAAAKAESGVIRGFDERLLDATYREFTEAWAMHGERAYLERLLAKADQNVTAAARKAQIGRTYLHRIIKRCFG